ncbi:UNVERIFIED_ORG: MFS family permease [Rhizobium sp. SORGH_AS260]|uniref:MFS transporter n=1 Tax=Agrobacterium sp. SORGH_AS_0440 TaxID=3041757 RepID=UPI0027827EF7|nr:MFS transporter [Agrobacterium sp. SORGH_AS_0440]MDP9734630.1 MFS family permease [Rhizobium sp. SORGH_AS_0285]MDP9756849.1 MFS family permease [Rhizobium sp. SORGH_AS_0260]MDR6083902.1 MFS family permease [Agrobacterium sp. SORGH_AS_0440]
MRLTRRVGSFFREEAWDFPEHERPMVAGSPATPEHALSLRIAYAFVAILVGLTGGLGNALVIVNIAEVRTGLALSVIQAAWLPMAYAMTNISANLLLIKLRQQYGLRVFTLIALGLYALLSLTYLLTADHWLTLAVRAASGFVAAALTPLSLFYVMQALPGRWRVRGLILGLGISQCAFPLATVISPWLSISSYWQSIFLFEAGLAFFSFAAVGTFRLPPAKRERAFEPLDFLTFLLLGGSLALIAAVLGLGRLEGWFEAPWIIWFLSLALPMIITALILENGRSAPLLNLRWLGSGDIVRFAFAIFMARIVLAEQHVATRFLTALGGSDEHLRALSIVTFVSAVAGVIMSAITVNVEKLVMPMMLAVTAIAAAAFVDSSATALEHLPRLYLSQAAISFSAMFFLGPALVLGITSALQKGGRELLSFTVLFGAINSIGALTGPALFGAYIDSIATASRDRVLAQQNALRLAAVLAFSTAAYLAVLLAIRVRHKLAEIRRDKHMSTIGAAHIDPVGPTKRQSGMPWHPPTLSFQARVVLSAIATTGAILLLVAVWPQER